MSFLPQSVTTPCSTSSFAPIEQNYSCPEQVNNEIAKMQNAECTFTAIPSNTSISIAENKNSYSSKCMSAHSSESNSIVSQSTENTPNASSSQYTSSHMLYNAHFGNIPLTIYNKPANNSNTNFNNSNNNSIYTVMTMNNNTIDNMSVNTTTPSSVNNVTPSDVSQFSYSESPLVSPNTIIAATHFSQHSTVHSPQEAQHFSEITREHSNTNSCIMENNSVINQNSAANANMYNSNSISNSSNNSQRNFTSENCATWSTMAAENMALLYSPLGCNKKFASTLNSDVSEAKRNSLNINANMPANGIANELDKVSNVQGHFGNGIQNTTNINYTNNTTNSNNHNSRGNGKGYFGTFSSTNNTNMNNNTNDNDDSIDHNKVVQTNPLVSANNNSNTNYHLQRANSSFSQSSHDDGPTNNRLQRATSLSYGFATRFAVNDNIIPGTTNNTNNNTNNNNSNSNSSNINYTKAIAADFTPSKSAPSIFSFFTSSSASSSSSSSSFISAEFNDAETHPLEISGDAQVNNCNGCELTQTANTPHNKGDNNTTTTNNNDNNSNVEHHECIEVTKEPTIEVYDPDFKNILTIRTSNVFHRPHPSFGVSRLVLCRNFVTSDLNSCTKNELCKFVHADVHDAIRSSIHVNYAWRTLELCSYARLPAGDELIVLAPNERPPSEVILSERVLLTRGSANWREHTSPLSHCAHYYFNRMCNRGERCSFIHTVFVDPTVQGNFKRAPAPTAVAPILAKPVSPCHTTLAPMAPATTTTKTVGGDGGAAAGAVQPAFLSQTQRVTPRGSLSANAATPPPPPQIAIPTLSQPTVMLLNASQLPAVHAMPLPMTLTPHSMVSPSLSPSPSPSMSMSMSSSFASALAPTLVPQAPCHINTLPPTLLHIPAISSSSLTTTPTPTPTTTTTPTAEPQHQFIPQQCYYYSPSAATAAAAAAGSCSCTVASTLPAPTLSQLPPGVAPQSLLISPQLLSASAAPLQTQPINPIMMVMNPIPSHYTSFTPTTQTTVNSNTPACTNFTHSNQSYYNNTNINNNNNTINNTTRQSSFSTHTSSEESRVVNADTSDTLKIYRATNVSGTEHEEVIQEQEQTERKQLSYSTLDSEMGTGCMREQIHDSLINNNNPEKMSWLTPTDSINNNSYRNNNKANTSTTLFARQDDNNSCRDDATDAQAHDVSHLNMIANLLAISDDENKWLTPISAHSSSTMSTAGIANWSFYGDLDEERFAPASKEIYDILNDVLQKDVTEDTQCNDDI